MDGSSSRNQGNRVVRADRDALEELATGLE
jgi:hypothetical protein